MRGTLKTAALEHYFPLLAVEHDCILSKNAEVTVAYRVVLPELFTSLRIGVGTALAVLFIVEAYGTRAGIGYYILDCWSRIDYLGMYGGIVLISLVGALLFLGVDLLAQRLCRWKQA